MLREFTAVIQKHDDWYIGFVEEIPGVNTQGQTLEEVRENLKEALELILDANRELARGETPSEEVIRESISVEI